MNVHLTKHGQGVPVVFFHGWGFDRQIWTPLIGEMSRIYQMILVDLPGFGFTPMMNWTTFKELLLNQLPIHFSVIGWSLGGLYAQRLALEESTRVQHLLSVASSPRFIADKTWPAVPKEILNHFYENLSLNPEGTLRDFVSLQLNKNRAELNIGKMPTKEGLEEGLVVLDNWDLRSDLKNFTNPACFMFGRLDPITPARLMNIMMDKYPQFKYLLFKRSAHMPFLSHTELFIEEVVRFIQ